MIESVLWWAIPLGVTLSSLGYAWFWPLGTPTFITDVYRIGLTILALSISTIAWIIGAFCK